MLKFTDVHEPAFSGFVVFRFNIRAFESKEGVYVDFNSKIAYLRALTRVIAKKVPTDMNLALFSVLGFSAVSLGLSQFDRLHAV